MLYTMTIQNGLATAKAEGFESTISMPISQMNGFMEEVTKIGKLYNIEIKWNVVRTMEEKTMDAWKPENPTIRNFELIGYGVVAMAMMIALPFMFVLFS